MEIITDFKQSSLQISMQSINFEQELNPEQLKIVRESDGPCLVLAGAGSGKTRTIVYRMAYLLERGIDPKKILLLTFTNKAANEMLGRVETLTGINARTLWGGTFHSIANRFLRRFAPLLDYKQNFNILDEDDSRSLIKACLKESGAPQTQSRFPSPAVVKSILSFVINSQISLEDALEQKNSEFYRFSEQFDEISRLYKKRKKESGSMDFDDLIFNFTEIFRNDLSARERIQNKFKYILIDEYQDTNPLQAEMVRLLEPKTKNILVVGDDAQSIYSFRGASVQNILNFPKTYPDAKIFRLETNYRSTPEILNLANDVIAKNTAQFPKELRAVHPGLLKPEQINKSSVEEEARFIADKIKAAIDSGARLNEIAVLFRAASHSESLEFELGKRGIAYDYRGGLRFFERSHIKDALAYLRILNEPKDEAAWRRILVNFSGIGEVTAEKIIAIARVSPREEILRAVGPLLGDKARAGWDEFSSIYCKLLEYIGEKPSELINAIVNSAYSDYLASEYENADDRLEDLGQLAVFAEKYDALADFLAEAILFEGYSAKDSRSGGSRVILSTIHQAKGMEWDTVFVMNLVDGAFPNERAMFEDNGIEEERRLFYVAITRAKRRLYLTYPETSRASFSWNMPSMFLQEIDESLLAGNVSKIGDDIEYIDENSSQISGIRGRSFLREVDEL
jgi:DNA helicase-2/ATP-dependent DNA helicase PcrA